MCAFAVVEEDQEEGFIGFFREDQGRYFTA